jgi:hypothetical protein
MVPISSLMRKRRDENKKKAPYLKTNLMCFGVF